jgi:DNA-binding SARP family transcriptional activator/class 3 adenylate cyclase
MSDGARILVVDDVPPNVRLLEAVLVPRGYDVVSATDGETALALLDSAKPDLVMLDVVMPPPDGYAVCRTIREREDTAMLPVIMITASTSEKTQAIQAGADDLIAKPFDQDELLARIRSLLRIKRYHDTITAQAAELTELNRTLEGRVEAQVLELEQTRKLRRFLSPQLADAVVSSGDDSILRSHRRKVAMLFADLRGWTSFVDAVEPEELMQVLGEFHHTIGGLVQRFDATVGFLEGDGVQLFFNDPHEVPDAPLRAIRFACALREEMAELTPVWRKRGYELDLGVGIALGYATCGEVGFEGRSDYAAIGAVTNLASRLADEATARQVLIPQRLYAEIEADVEVEPVGEFMLKGFRRPILAFNVLAVNEPSVPNDDGAPSGRRLGFRLLGPVEVVDGSGPIPLGGPKQRLVLTHLLLNANQVVPADTLIDGIWAEEPPPTARNTLQAYVSNLRKAIGSDRIEGRTPGYILHAEPAEIDIASFESAVRVARSHSGDPERLAEALREALAIWQGPALADLAHEPSVRADAVRLEDLRLQTLEERIAAEMELGRHQDLAGELETLVSAHAMRERLWAQLMLVLYRSGRQAEALGAYQRARELLSDELGIDPSHDLQQLHEQILRQDPDLQLSVVT